MIVTSPNPPQGLAFIYIGQDPGLTRIRAGLHIVTGSLSKLSCRLRQVIFGRLILRVTRRPLALSRRLARPMSHLQAHLRLGPALISLLLNRQQLNPAPPGRVISRGYIPDIRPQIDLNWFMSIFISSGWRIFLDPLHHLNMLNICLTRHDDVILLVSEKS